MGRPIYTAAKEEVQLELTDESHQESREKSPEVVREFPESVRVFCKLADNRITDFRPLIWYNDYFAHRWLKRKLIPRGMERC